MKEKKLMVRDDFKKTFSEGPVSEIEMGEFLLQVDESSTWKEVELECSEAKSILAGPMFVPSVKDELKLTSDVTDEAVCSTCDPENYDGSRFAWFAQGRDYLLSKTGLSSLVLRLGADSSRFSKLLDSDKQTVLNCYTKIAKNKARCLYRFQKMRAVNGSDYSILPQGELFKSLTDKLTADYPNYEFCGGQFEHDFTEAHFLLVDQAKELLEDYKDKISSATGLTKLENCVPAVSFQTSDSGASCASITTKLVNKNNKKFVINLGSPLLLPHKNEATVEKFKSLLDGMFAQFQEQVSKLDALLDVKIEHPINAVISIAKKCNLSKPALREAIETFAPMFTSSATAHDVFYILQEALYNMRCNTKLSRVSVLTAEENIARCLSSSFDWKAEDLSFTPDI